MLRQDDVRWNRNPGALLLRQRDVATRGEVGLHATGFDGTTHRCLDKVGQGLAGQQHGIEINTQLRLNTDLRNDGDFHSSTVVQTHYILKLWL